MDIPRLDDDIVVKPTKIHQRRAKRFEKHPNQGAKAAKILDAAEKQVHNVIKAMLATGMTANQIWEAYTIVQAKEGNPLPAERKAQAREIIFKAIERFKIPPAPEYKPRYDPYARRRKK